MRMSKLVTGVEVTEGSLAQYTMCAGKLWKSKNPEIMKELLKVLSSGENGYTFSHEVATALANYNMLVFENTLHREAREVLLAVFRKTIKDPKKGPENPLPKDDPLYEGANKLLASVR